MCELVAHRLNNIFTAIFICILTFIFPLICSGRERERERERVEYTYRPNKSAHGTEKFGFHPSQASCSSSKATKLSNDAAQHIELNTSSSRDIVPIQYSTNRKYKFVSFFFLFYSIVWGNNKKKITKQNT